MRSTSRVAPHGRVQLASTLHTHQCRRDCCRCLSGQGKALVVANLSPTEQCPAADIPNPVPRAWPRKAERRKTPSLYDAGLRRRRSRRFALRRWCGPPRSARSSATSHCLLALPAWGAMRLHSLWAQLRRPHRSRRGLHSRCASPPAWPGCAAASALVARRGTRSIRFRHADRKLVRKDL